MTMKLDYSGQFDALIQSVLQPPSAHQPTVLRCADFFCGIGGFHVAASNLGLNVVCACDVDECAQYAYVENFDLKPFGNLVDLQASDVPNHDILCAGFPCQPFSIIGRQQGFFRPTRQSLF